MKFVLATTTRYWWPVTVRLPDPAAPGKMLEQTFKILFEPQDREEVLKQQEAFLELKTELERVAHEYEQLRTFCKDWDDVVSESGSAIPFTPENFDAAIKQPWFRSGVYLALNTSQNGEEARLGN